MSQLGQDFRQALRALRTRPGFSAIAILTLALGIGVNSAMYSVVDALLFRSLPGVEKQGELIALMQKRPEFSFPISLSYPTFQDYRGLDSVYSDAIASGFTLARMAKGTASESQRAQLTLVSGNYFSFLGLKPVVGRFFSPEESETMGAGNVLVLSHDQWKRNFDADPGVVGRTVQLNGNSFTIIGVTPAEFRGTQGLLLTDGFVPVTAGDLLGPGTAEWLKDRNNGGFNVIARLQPGIRLQQAQQASFALSERLAKDWPDSHQGLRAVLYPESRTRLETAAADFLPPIAVTFMTLVGLVLLIACANVANLLLVRGIGRRKELAVRAALGASRWRIARYLLVESLVLALLGGVAGLLIAQWGTDLLSSVQFATDLRMQMDFRPNMTVFWYAFGIAAFAGLMAGLAPVFQSSKTDLVTALKESGGRGGSTRHRLRSALVILQLGVSLVLLVSAGLFVRSTWNVAGMDFGFQVEHRLMLSTDPDLGGLDQDQARRFYDQLLEQVRAMPGVQGATTARYVPFGYQTDGDTVRLEGGDPKAKESSMVFSNVVGTDYFRVMGTQITAGREFSTQDTMQSPKVAVVNQRFAEVYWPGQSPLGKRFSLGRQPDQWVEVVGITSGTPHLMPGEHPKPFLYLPSGQHAVIPQILHVWAQQSPESLFPVLRETVRGLAPEVPIFDVRTMATHIRDGKATILFQLGSSMVGTFGLIGLILAGIGLYGVMSFSVGQRTREFGIRIALGASSRDLIGGVLGHGLVLALAGVAVGMAAAVATTGLFAHLLVEVSPTDPATFGVVGGLLVVIALAASFVPARRATKVDPMLSLRSD